MNFLSKPKVALSLRGGSVRTATYLGLFKALEEEKIEIDMIIGSSGGAYVAGLYGAGVPIPKIIEHFGNQHFTNYFGIESLKSLSVISTQKTIDYLYEITEGKKLEENRIKTFIQVSNLESAESEIFESGDLAEIIFASCAIPIFTIPYRIGDHLYIDGDITSTYATDFLRKQGAKVVIGVSPFDDRKPNIPYSDSPYARVRTTIDLATRRLRENEVAQSPPDLLLRKLTGEIQVKMLDTSKVSDLVEVGYKETKRRIPEIKSAIAKKRFFGF